MWSYCCLGSVPDMSEPDVSQLPCAVAISTLYLADCCKLTVVQPDKLVQCSLRMSLCLCKVPNIWFEAQTFVIKYTPHPIVQ